MNDLSQIISNSSFNILDGEYVYAKVARVPSRENHFMVSCDKNEITVVTKKENLSTIDLLEQNKDFYRLICLNISVPFYSVGFLAAISNSIATLGINILIISTYSKDYLAINTQQVEVVCEALQNLGLTKES